MTKTRCFVLFVSVISSFSMTSLFAADSASIERVRKSVGTAKLSAADVQIVNRFLSESSTEMLLAEDLTQVSEIRSMIVAQKGASMSQYAIEFASAVKSTLTVAFSQIATIPEGLRRTHLELNFVILAAEIKSVRLADFGLKMANNDNSAIQYWAIKTIAFVAERPATNSMLIPATGFTSWKLSAFRLV